MYPNNSSNRAESRSVIRQLVMSAIASVAIVGNNTPAQAANFNFTYAPGTSLEQMLGFEMAGGIWASHLSDNATINIHMEVTDQLPSGVVGGALPGMRAGQSYETWRNQLAGDRTSADDQFIFNNQQDDADKFTALIDGFKVDNNYALKMTRANAKAVGMIAGNDKALDGYTLMNKLTNKPVSWNYDFVGGNVSKGTMDYLSVGIHELTHHLGVVSGVDKAGWLTQKTQYDSSHQSDFYATLNGKLDHATPLDLFRFSAESVKQAGSGDSWIDMSVGGKPYFSTDGGKTVLGYFSTGDETSLGGDGNQASHWKQQDNPLGILDPVLRSGERRNISGLDRKLLDAIGWNLQPGETNLATLQSQAKLRLAQRIGKTVEWLDANPAEAASLLSQDRTQEVQSMIEQSRVYDWRASSSSGFWQDTAYQHFLWQEVSGSGTDQPEKTAVPEPSTIGGLIIGGGLLGVRRLLKRRSQKRVIQ
ncbi:NF038122 family metalloprotease [Phormidesmis sp. 146-33]